MQQQQSMRMYNLFNACCFQTLINHIKKSMRNLREWVECLSDAYTNVLSTCLICQTDRQTYRLTDRRQLATETAMALFLYACQHRAGPILISPNGALSNFIGNHRVLLLRSKIITEINKVQLSSKSLPQL